MARAPNMPERSTRGLCLLWGGALGGACLLGERQEAGDGLSRGRGRCGAGPGGCQARGYFNGLGSSPYLQHWPHG